MSHEFHIYIYNGDRGKCIGTVKAQNKMFALSLALIKFPDAFIEFQTVGVYQQ